MRPSAYPGRNFSTPTLLAGRGGRGCPPWTTLSRPPRGHSAEPRNRARAFDNTQKIRVQGEHPLPPRPLRCCPPPNFGAPVAPCALWIWPRGKAGGGGGVLLPWTRIFCVQAKRHVASRGSPECPRGVRLSVVHGGSTPPPLRADYAATLTKEWREDESDDGHQLDEDVHARPRGVLERIPHRVPDHSGLVRLQPLAAEVPRLDVLLRVVPRASRVGHEEREEDTHQRGAGEEAAQRFLAEHEAHEGWHHHRGEARHDHLLECGTSGDVHAARGVGLGRALHEPG